MEFKSIEDEEYREYEWANGAKVRVSGKGLNVSASGGHRIEGVDGVSHYIPSGWIHLKWQSKPGKPAFAF